MQDQKKRLLAAFELMDAEERDVRVEEFENATRGRTLRRASLTLVPRCAPTELPLRGSGS